MKSILALFLSIVSIIFATQVEAEPAPTSKDLPVAITDVYIPAGFDSRMESYVIVGGFFPNSCYKWKGATKIDITNFEHEITSVATVTQGLCLMVLVPFLEEVRLGELEVGTHKLRFISSDGTFLEKSLTIEE